MYANRADAPGLADDLDSVFPLGEVLVPLNCKARSESFSWTGLELKEPARDAPILDDFVRLGHAPDEQIVKYAKRFGILGFCEHGYFGGHSFSRSGNPNDVESCPKHYWERDNEGDELFRTWRTLSRRVNAILKVADRLNCNLPGREEDWTTIFGSSVRDPNMHYHRLVALGAEPLRDFFSIWMSPHHPFDPTLERELLLGDELRLGEVASEKELLADTVNLCLRISGVRPWAKWLGQKPTFVVSGGGLFGALALRLTYAVCATEGYAICDACSQFDRPNRKPKSGQRFFCKECRENKEPIKYAMRDARLRNKARALHKSGIPLEEIARQLERDSDQVRKWLGIGNNGKGDSGHDSKTRRK